MIAVSITKKPEGSERLSNRFHPGFQPGSVGLNVNPVVKGMASDTGKG